MTAWTTGTYSGIVALVAIAVFTSEPHSLLNWWPVNGGHVKDEMAYQNYRMEGEETSAEAFFQVNDEVEVALPADEGLLPLENAPISELKEQDSYVQLNPKFADMLEDMSKRNHSLPMSVVHSIQTLVKEHHINSPRLAKVLNQDIISDISPFLVRKELEIFLTGKKSENEELYQKLLKSHSEMSGCEEKHSNQLVGLQHELTLLDTQHKTCRTGQTLTHLGTTEACQKRDEIVKAMLDTRKRDCFTPSLITNALSSDKPDIQALLEMENNIKENQKWIEANALVYLALERFCLHSPDQVSVNKSDCDAKQEHFETASCSMPAKQWELCDELSQCYTESKEHFERTVTEVRQHLSKWEAMRDSILDLMCLIDNPADFSSCKSELLGHHTTPEKFHLACDNYRAPDLTGCSNKTVTSALPGDKEWWADNYGTWRNPTAAEADLKLTISCV